MTFFIVLANTASASVQRKRFVIADKFKLNHVNSFQGANFQPFANSNFMPNICEFEIVPICIL